MDSDPRLNAIAAGNISSAAIIASLIGTLGAKRILSGQEVREVYEQALLMLEMVRAEDPAMQAIYAEAREVIEEQLRP